MQNSIRSIRVSASTCVRVFSRRKRCRSFSSTAILSPSVNNAADDGSSLSEESTFILTETTNGLERPEILYSSNHLLAVNKPPGWHSIPNTVTHRGFCKTMQHRPIDPMSKCLLTYLAETNKLGGGSTKAYLKPLHRIDQPCSGVLLIAKTTKAASRVQGNWGMFLKTYLVVVQPSTAQGEALLVEQQRDHPEKWKTLCAKMLRPFELRKDYFQKENNSQKEEQEQEETTNKGWSVAMTPFFTSDADTKRQLKKQYVELEWKFVTKTTSSTVTNKDATLLLVRTRQGKRHMIRCLFAVHGLVICGDLRYGPNDNTMLPLPDQSVALHARSLRIPDTFSIGHNLQRHFEAPIPPTWDEYFGLREKELLSRPETRGHLL